MNVCVALTYIKYFIFPGNTSIKMGAKTEEKPLRPSGTWGKILQRQTEWPDKVYNMYMFNEH